MIACPTVFILLCDQGRPVGELNFLKNDIFKYFLTFGCFCSSFRAVEGSDHAKLC